MPANIADVLIDNGYQMKDQVKSTIVLIAVALLIQACGMFKDKPEEYLLSKEGEKLIIPEDLDSPTPVNPVEIHVQTMHPPAGDELNPMPPKAAITAGGGEANAYMAWSGEGAYLAVKDNPESVVKRLRTAIEESGMSLLLEDEEGGHHFEYEQVPIVIEKTFKQKMAFWRDDKILDYSGTYQCRLQPDGKETRVYLMNEANEAVPTNTAEHVLGIFMEELG